jgi:hypothetical protein
LTVIAPWVMKTDNGSAFIAEVLARFLARRQVLSLFSPPRTPSAPLYMGFGEFTKAFMP